jgi:hypothetical protein
VNEIVSILVTDHEGGPVDFKLKAVAVRPQGEEPWQIFMAGDDADLWIAAMEVAEVPRVMAIHPEEARYFVNLAQLLGDPWDLVWQDTPGVVIEQAIAMEKMSSKIENGLKLSEPHDVRAYREQMFAAPPTDGEVMRQEITGVRPFAGRN